MFVKSSDFYIFDILIHFLFRKKFFGIFLMYNFYTCILKATS